MTEIRKIEGPPGVIDREVAAEARLADIFVATCPYRADTSTWDNVIEAALLGAGRSLYFVPPGFPPRDRVRSVLIAWKDGREITRAVAEAMPFLVHAEQTTVAFVTDAAGSEEVPMGTMNRIATHLSHHGVKPGLRTLDGAAGSVVDLLLEEAQLLSADLIVAGAYGRSRFKQWLVGGSTREFLRISPIPLLMAH
jgi:nucleotide-binding universal stress UspA family protein